MIHDIAVVAVTIVRMEAPADRASSVARQNGDRKSNAETQRQGIGSRPFMPSGTTAASELATAMPGIRAAAGCRE
jgi:hypothetical protein